jgi:O-antigen/teichoic acid export membrane protein
VVTLYGEEFRGAVAIVKILVFASGPIAVDFIASHAVQLRRGYRFLLTLRTAQLLLFVGGAVWLCDRGYVLGLCWLVVAVFAASSLIMSAWLAVRNGSYRPREVGEV